MNKYICISYKNYARTMKSITKSDKPWQFVLQDSGFAAVDSLRVRAVRDSTQVLQEVGFSETC